MNISRKLAKEDQEITQPRFSINNMDATAGPRHDFYRYSAGNWLDKNPIPPDKTEWGVFYELTEWNMKVLHDIVEKCAYDIEAETYPASLIGKFYISATNEKLIEKQRFAPIEDLWDMISGAKSTEEMIRLIPKLHLAGIDALFDAYSDVDAKDSSTYALYLQQGGLSLPERDYYLLDSFADKRNEFREHMARMFMLKGVKEDKAHDWANSILELETSIAKASRSSTDLRDVEKNYNRIETDTFEARFPTLSMSGYLYGLGAGEVSYTVMGQPEFFDFLEKMLDGIDPEKLRAYLYWNVLITYGGSLHEEVYNEVFDFFGRKLTGQQQPEPRWRRAIRRIDAQVGEALGKLYVEKQFGGEAHEKALELVKDIIDVFRSKLKIMDWMSEETRNKAVEKLDAMNIKIGYPVKFRDYSRLEIKPDDYVGNIRRSFEFELMRQISEVGKPVDKTEWEMTPPAVNAYYSAERNEIVFPAGILQPPFFDANIDDAINYGSIGAVIGHEITHGFDDEGRHYDSKGNIKDWWTEEDAKRFNEKANGIIEAYGSQEALPGVFINGSLTLGENIADLGGVDIAYAALQRDFSRHPERRKPVDGLTPDQRFFIAYAQTWMSNIREDALRMRLTVDPHSPAKYRATIPAINHPAFDTAFPPNASESKSAPNKHIGVW